MLIVVHPRKTYRFQGITLKKRNTGGVGVVGSNPAAPTNFFHLKSVNYKYIQNFPWFLHWHFSAISGANFVAENEICDSRATAAGCRSCCKTKGRGRNRHSTINDKHQMSMVCFCCLCSRQAVIMPALVINIMPTQPLVVGQTPKITLPQIAANNR